MVTSEFYPLIRSGGLGDMVGSLCEDLRRRYGYEIRVILPKYEGIEVEGLELRIERLEVWMGGDLEVCRVFEVELGNGVWVDLLEHNFFNRVGLYGEGGVGYGDNGRRFGLLSRAVFGVCEDLGWEPDVIHGHDWVGGLVGKYLKREEGLEGVGFVLTIHNGRYDWKSKIQDEDYLGLEGGLGFLEEGIRDADIVTTVSKGYREELLQGGLGFFLEGKGDNFVGILNGVDYGVWDPILDGHLVVRYGLGDLVLRGECKSALRGLFDLSGGDERILVGMVGRICEEKGYGLLREILDDLIVELGVQMVILGSGEVGMEEFLKGKAVEHRGELGVRIGFDEKLSRWIYGGVDFFLMPSLEEPCGLSQLYAMRYGAIPIVRATGGLDDTVREGVTGFKFYGLKSMGLYEKMRRVIWMYDHEKGKVEGMRRSGMEEDFSWVRSAGKYGGLYEELIKKKRQKNNLEE